MKATKHDELRRLIGVVEAERAGIPALGNTVAAEWMTYPKTEYRKASEKAFHRLASRERAEFRDPFDGLEMTLAGIKAKSTRGTDALFANWVRAAELKLNAEVKLGLDR